MREIKFRLRDRHNKIVGYEKWYPGSYISEQHYWIAIPCWLYSEDGQHWNPKPIAHSKKDQYTGLKDKNSKEVYEGDIVKRIGDFGTIQYPDLKELIDVVEFKGACFMPICEEPMENFEIIGNIYENPELGDK